MKIKMTAKEEKVINFLFKNDGYWNPIHFSFLKPIIFSKEIIDKYSHARRNKVIIETMTLSYLGKMARKGLVKNDIGTGCFSLSQKAYKTEVEKNKCG